VGESDGIDQYTYGYIDLKVYDTAPSYLEVHSPEEEGATYENPMYINTQEGVYIHWDIDEPAFGDYPMSTDVFYSKNGTNFSLIRNTTTELAYDFCNEWDE